MSTYVRVVTADVPPYALAGGNPVRLITEHARTIMAGMPASIERLAAENGLQLPHDSRVYPGARGGR